MTVWALMMVWVSTGVVTDLGTFPTREACTEAVSESVTTLEESRKLQGQWGRAQDASDVGFVCTPKRVPRPAQPSSRR